MNGDWTSLGPGAEFDLIRRMTRRWGDLARGVGDDAAVLDVPGGARLVASTDMSVEGVHFRQDWLSMEDIGYRSATAALSDLAAMAADPMGLLVAVSIPRALAGKVEALADGIGAAARMAESPIVGGDLARGDRIALTVTVLGSVRKPMFRRGASPGDALFVTGRLGGPGAALKGLIAGDPAPAHLDRFRRPVARLAEARWLAASGATAMLDISDGLSSDARHLAAASDVSLRIDLGALPVVTGVQPREAAVSGEEYELLLTAPDELDCEAFRQRFALPLTRIGRVGTAGEPRVTFHQGEERVDPEEGYDHFSG